MLKILRGYEKQFDRYRNKIILFGKNDTMSVHGHNIWHSDYGAAGHLDWFVMFDKFGERYCFEKFESKRFEVTGNKYYELNNPVEYY